jgi:hypothetical protein
MMTIGALMKYGILEIQEVYSLWKSSGREKKESFAISFSSTIKHAPLIYVGNSSVRKFLDTKIFDDAEIAYLHSLQKKNGTFLFPDAFIKLLSELTFHLDIKSPLEGTVIFPGEPMLKVSGNSLVLPFFKKLLAYYLPGQIQVATEIEKIVSYISPAYLITENPEKITQQDESLNSASAYIGGSIACEDLSAAVAYKIPICFHDVESDLIFLDVSDKHFNQKVALLQPEDKVFLKGGVTMQLLEDYPYLIPRLKGISISITNLFPSLISMKIHLYKNCDVLDSEFMIYRFSHKGLFIGDILTSDIDIEHRKMVFGKSMITLSYAPLLQSLTADGIETVKQARSRSLKNMRLLPCKHRGDYSKDVYPVRILPKAKIQENIESPSNTKLA